MVEVIIFSCPIGNIRIGEKDGSIFEILFTNEKEKQSSSKILNMAKNQLLDYFNGERKAFTIPINVDSLPGTIFQRKTWKALQSIPYGKTLSYKELAEKVGLPKAYRAVGNANGKNPISIVIPCHRVIASDNSIGGYTGGLEKKVYLLNIEKE